jgi:predicted RNase H-like HicB family nuclease
LPMTFSAVFTRAPEGGYTAIVEEIPGAISEGETLEEARENLVDALRMVLACNREIARQDASGPAIRESFELAAL